MLSLTAFGRSKVHLNETFFTARVNLRGKMFDQLFFIVDSEQHEVLLGLSAITVAGMHLITADGTESIAARLERVTNTESRRNQPSAKNTGCNYCKAAE